MKPLSTILLVIAFFITGFVAGSFFSKLAIERNELNYLIGLHDFQRKRTKETSIASDTILHRIGKLIDNETILSKGQASKDPIKNLLLQSYECISGNMQVLGNYERQVYPQDSAFLKNHSSW